ncbi:MAG: glycosyltransferase family protein [Candidatus Altiarchaeota archaeon]
MWAVWDLVFSRSVNVLIPDFPPPNTICGENLVCTPKLAAKLLYTGPLIRASNEDSNDSPACDVLLVLNTGFSSSLMREIIETMDDAPDLTCHVVGSQAGDWPNSGSFQNIGLTDNVLQHIVNSKVVVSTGGHTTICESVCSGKPIMCSPISNHNEQENNIRFLEVKKLGIRLSQDASHQVVSDGIRCLLEGGEYRLNCGKFRGEYRQNAGTYFSRLLKSINSL